MTSSCWWTSTWWRAKVWEGKCGGWGAWGDKLLLVDIHLVESKVVGGGVCLCVGGERG